MIYEIDATSREHKWVGLPCLGHYPAPGKIWVHSDLDGWIHCYDGLRECPVPPGTVIEYRKRNGEVKVTLSPEYRRWHHNSVAKYNDIIAYRPILDTNTKPEPPRCEYCDGTGDVPPVGAYVEYPTGRGVVKLPPIGTVCEYQNNQCCNWRKIQITAIGKERILFWDFELDCELSLLIRSLGNFRPYRSDKEKAIDNLAADILDTVNRDGFDFQHQEHVVAERLYEMGYRKETEE